MINKSKIKEIELIINKHTNLLSDEEIKALNNEKTELEKSLIKYDSNLEKKYINLFYSKEEIENAPDLVWLINNLIPLTSIGVLIGSSGSGKTTVAIKLCKELLNQQDTYIYYIDGDMSLQKTKEHNVSELYESNRFYYVGKESEIFSDSAQSLISDLAKRQKEHPNRKYIVIEDSLSLIARKKRGFIDTDELYKNEKKLRSVGGTSIIIHHTNKKGEFADTQHIENFADYTYLIERNDFNSCIILHKQKASRYDIHNKAYSVKDRKITTEIDYELANIPHKEVVFINYIIDVLEEGELNQSEVIKYLEKIRFFSDYKVGQRKVQNWLKKWAKKGKWSFEQRADKKNAIYFFIDKSEKLDKLDKQDDVKD